MKLSLKNIEFKYTLINVQNVSKSYGLGDAKIFALNNVSLKISSGEILVIQGHSGSGKSTLLNIIGGIDNPESGTILFGSDDISQYNDKELTNYRKTKIGYIFQYYNLVEDLTVMQNIMLAPGANKNEKYAKQILDDVGILNKKDSYPSQLSGGQQQRVSIARAINKSCEVLLCDEPTGALDYNSSKDVIELLLKINKQYNKTIVIATHNPEIAQISERIAFMKDGELIIKSNQKSSMSQ